MDIHPQVNPLLSAKAGKWRLSNGKNRSRCDMRHSPIAEILHRAKKKNRRNPEERIHGGLNSEKKPGIERAGWYIGILERSLVLTAVLFGKMEFIGYIFAAKSIARYPEMKEGSHFAEYYLIGTLTSISIAFFGGLLLKYLLGW